MSTAVSTRTPFSMFTTYLPEEFEPSENEVLIGRGRKIVQHSGNVKLRNLVQLKAKDYCQTGDKTFKSFIISEIGNQIKRESRHGGFVKKDVQNDKWYVVSDSCVRATIAQAFRDCLSPNYRSSKFSKQRRRWCQKTTTKQSSSSSSSNLSCVAGSETCAVTDAAAISSGVVVGKPLLPVVEESFCSLPPLTQTVMSLQSVLRAPTSSDIGSTPSLSPTELPKLSSSSSVAGTTSDILRKCLEVLDDDDDNDEGWFSYTDNPFESDPIAEKTQQGGAAASATTTTWWF